MPAQPARPGMPGNKVRSVRVHKRCKALVSITTLPKAASALPRGSRMAVGRCKAAAGNCLEPVYSQKNVHASQLRRVFYEWIVSPADGGNRCALRLRDPTPETMLTEGQTEASTRRRCGERSGRREEGAPSPQAPPQGAAVLARLVSSRRHGPVSALHMTPRVTHAKPQSQGSVIL